jgi:hypothetical protein
MASLDEDTRDDAALEALGYKNELSRGMTLWCEHWRGTGERAAPPVLL